MTYKCKKCNQTFNLPISTPQTNIRTVAGYVSPCCLSNYDTLTCTKCNLNLSKEEIESPRKDKDGDIICDDCFEELYMYHCPICQEFFEEDFSKDISPQYFIITKDGEEDFVGDAGTYEIINYPFYADGMIEFHLIKFAFKKIADLPEFDEDEFYNSMYYICDECVKKHLEKTHAD